MHIGINTLSVIPGETGGGETYLTGLLRALSAVDSANRYTLFVGPENRTTFASLGDAFEPVVMPFSQRVRTARVFYEHFRLPRIASRRGINVLYCPGNAATFGRRFATVLGIQSLLPLLSPHEAGRWRALYFRRVMPTSSRRAERIIAVSADIRRALLAATGVDETKIRVIHEGVDASFRRLPEEEVRRELAAFGLQPGFLLFVSTLKPYKNADKLIRAVAHLKRETGDTPDVVIIGRDPLGLTPQLRTLAAELGVTQQVRFVGPVAHDRLPSFYSAADVFMFPSAIETFGLPVLEAMACGTPVLASNRTAVPEVVGDAGLCVDPDDVPAMAQALHRLRHDDALRRTLVARGLERVRLFTWERAARQTLEVFEEAYAIHQKSTRFP